MTTLLIISGFLPSDHTYLSNEISINIWLLASSPVTSSNPVDIGHLSLLMTLNPTPKTNYACFDFLQPCLVVGLIDFILVESSSMFVLLMTIQMFPLSLF